MTPMARLCERPGCSEHGAIAYGFDADRTLVWLAPLEPDADRNRAGTLCVRHADAMVVPVGWSLEDARDPTARLFRPTGRARPARPKRRTKPAQPAAGAAPARPPTKRGPKATPELGEAVVTEQLTLGVVPTRRASEPASPPTPESPTPGLPETKPPPVEAATVSTEPVAPPTVVAVTGVSSGPDDSDATVSIPWMPDFDIDDDLDGTLHAETPLLARAFRGIDRQS